MAPVRGCLASLKIRVAVAAPLVAAAAVPGHAGGGVEPTRQHQDGGAVGELRPHELGR
jgi:hypothetical protein